MMSFVALVCRKRGRNSGPKQAFGVSHESLEGRRLFAAILWTETFDALPFGPNQEEALVGENVWTNTAPAGWVNDITGVTGFDQPADNNGVKEWSGWSFAQRDWWSTTAGDQTRTQFKRASGGVMIADPDEWDDAAHPAKTAGWPADQLYNAKITTGDIPLAGGIAGTYAIELDSSWRPEGFDDGQNVNNQTGIIEALYSDGTVVEILRYDSDPFGTFFKGDAQNEHVVLPLNIPAGATSLKLRFTLGKAANDWWWAVDNVALTAAPDVRNVQLVGVSSSEGAVPGNMQSLFGITYTTGATPTASAAKMIGLPSVPGGDAIGFNSETGLLHHTSGGSSTSDTPSDPGYRDNQ